jgi:methyltransferase (TIGR00027 family)
MHFRIGTLMPIENVSDTARWVAVYRAMETDRPDAIFRDPFARRLAGPEGEAIVKAIPNGLAIAPPLIVRTAVLDELILERIKNHGVDLVLNLAAGLDARPWRLPLPPALHWVDVDLPGILTYKTDTLRDERPVCRYEAIAVDLTQPDLRNALFARLGAAHQRVLVITEGLLIYLKPEHVADLGRALHQPPSFQWWLMDLASPRLLRYIERSHGSALRSAPFLFAPAEGTAFFRPLGWREEVFRSTIVEARRLRREMRGAWLYRVMATIMPARRVDEFRRMSGIVMLARNAP